MELSEYIKKKEALKSSIVELIVSFESKTGIIINNIWYNRKDIYQGLDNPTRTERHVSISDNL